MSEDVDPYEVIETYWPYDGPYSDERTWKAATALGQLVRYLNNATQKADALPYAPAAYRLLSGVSAAAYGLHQLTDQLALFAARQADDPTLYDDRRDRPGRDTAVALAFELIEMRPVIADLAGRLQEAHALASHLGHEDTAADEQEGGEGVSDHG